MRPSATLYSISSREFCSRSEYMFSQNVSFAFIQFGLMANGWLIHHVYGLLQLSIELNALLRREEVVASEAEAETS